MSELTKLCDAAKAHGQLFCTGNLTNQIHPLLARENFVGSIDYDSMVPVLRLLTRLLNTPQVRHYLFFTFFGRNERVCIQDNHGRDLEAYTSDRPSIANLSHSDIAAVGLRLREMAKVVNFEVSARYKHEKNRWCVPVDSTPECDVPRARSNANRLQGVHSTIFIAKFWYDAITDPNNKHIIRDRFSVALILLHELGHAANNAVVGKQKCEDFFDDALIAEAGYEIQARLLGAAYAAKPGQQGVLFKWPSRPVLKVYRDELPVKSLQNIPEVVKRWYVPDDFITAASHDWFWAWAEQKGPITCVPEPVVAAMREAVVKGERMPVPRTVVDLFEEPSAPAFGCKRRRSRPRTLRQRVEVIEQMEREEGWAAIATIGSEVKALGTDTGYLPGAPSIVGGGRQIHVRAMQ